MLKKHWQGIGATKFSHNNPLPKIKNKRNMKRKGCSNEENKNPP
jgi:hypothetical protein